MADLSEFTGTEHQPPAGVELVACSLCKNTDHLTVTGRWDNPLTFTCSRCDTTTVFDEPHKNRGQDVGRNLMRRLVLTEADPDSRARSLLQHVNAFHDSERQRREYGCYRGPYGGKFGSQSASVWRPALHVNTHYLDVHVHRQHCDVHDRREPCHTS